MNKWKVFEKIKGVFRCIGLVLVLVLSVQMAQAEDYPVLPGDDQLAMHQGRPHGGRYERHSLHHGMGRGGKGICPQTRKTPKAPPDLQTLKNPLEPSQKNLGEGENLYHYKSQPSSCKVCHGANGNGLGMMASASEPMPTNFTCKETMASVTDGQMFWIIKKGSPGTEMPPYQLFLSDEQIWQLVMYVRTFIKD
ncbi:MAG: cytochrome c [Candidatus Nitronauta litoralis]|uniref:Cytochrome c n=1 Tax=Candidatus Nitronauta litoralis TaxID=2705533 RepID=A0A7T0FZD5_9BACT|nr:MAG: cytochrome c [Candidatus Nitronauta litoralis]